MATSSGAVMANVDGDGECVVDPVTLRSAIAGDLTAVERVLTVLRPLVLRYCRARLNSGSPTFEDADDCAQETLLGALRALPSYRHAPDRFLAFVYGIAAHKVVDHRRRQGRDRSTTVTHFPDNETVPGAACQAEYDDRHLKLSSLLGKLPPVQRDILVLRIVLGLSAAETACVMNLSSAGAVRVAQHRALTVLRSHLKGL